MFLISIFILGIHVVNKGYKERFKNTLTKQSGSVMFKKKKKRKETGKGRSWAVFRQIHRRVTVFYRSRTPIDKDNRQFFTLIRESSISLYPLCEIKTHRILKLLFCSPSPPSLKMLVVNQNYEGLICVHYMCLESIPGGSHSVIFGGRRDPEICHS